MTPVQRLAVLLAAMAIAFGAAWQVQEWRYGRQLAEQDRLHQSDLNDISSAAAAPGAHCSRQTPRARAATVDQ